jgi:hypothetical protein
LSEEEKQEIDSLISDDIWLPLPGPQTTAYESQADVIGYGGAAGGGKTDLAIGLALTKHRRVAIFRREGPQLIGIIDRMEEMIGNKDGYNGKDKIWRLKKLVVEFCSAPHPGDEKKYQGRPKDLLIIDEAANFIESQIRFIMGWVRTTIKGQKCTTLMTFNPPTDDDGEWVIPFFAPWLDKKHPKPAEPGELRWFATLDGKDMELANGDRFEHSGETVIPQSRTFIPSKVTDNPFLVDTGYIAQLQSLPEPLRSQMLHGDFLAGRQDNPWQVIPTQWVEQAQARWTEEGRTKPLDSMGVDVARGGDDETVIARRHGAWFDHNDVHPGKATPDGQTVAGLVFGKRKDNAPVHVDVIGVGASVYDQLKLNGVHTIALNSSEKSEKTDKSKSLSFRNKRAELWWMLREALDPESGDNLSLPPSDKLKADLCVPRWKMSAGGIQIESKEDIYKRIQRSTNDGDAVVYANEKTRKRDMRIGPSQARVDFDVFA